MRIIQIFCLLAGIGLVFAAPSGAGAAESLDYSYLQLNLVGRDIDAFDDDADALEDFDDGGGMSIDGSLELGDTFFIYGGYSKTESDVTFASMDVFPIPANTDIKRVDLGLGAVHQISDRTDLVGRIGYVDIDFGEFDFGESSDPSASDLLDDSSDGYSIDASLRSQLTDSLEGSIGLRYIDVQEFDDANLLAALVLELSPSWDLDFAIDAGDEVSTYLIGVRFSPIM